MTHSPPFFFLPPPPLSLRYPGRQQFGPGLWGSGLHCCTYMQSESTVNTFCGVFRTYQYAPRPRCSFLICTTALSHTYKQRSYLQGPEPRRLHTCAATACTVPSEKESHIRPRADHYSTNANLMSFPASVGVGSTAAQHCSKHHQQSSSFLRRSLRKISAYLHVLGRDVVVLPPVREEKTTP